PYHLAGTVMEKSVSLSGDWGLSFNINNSHSDRFDGAFTMESFPVKISDSIFTFSLDSAFSYSKRDGFHLNIAKFETEDAGSRFNFHPHLFFSGSVSKYGAFLQNISYSDKFSALGGDLNLIWNINDSIFSSAALDFNLKNHLSSESFKLTAELSNLSGQVVNGKNYKDALYLNSQLVLTNLALSRFLTEISDNNQFTGTFIASGTLDNPYIAAKVDSVKLMAAGQLLSVSGSGYVEEKELTLENINVAYSGFDLSGIKAKFDLEKFTGDANASFDALMGDKNLHVPISLTMTDSRIPEGSLFPEDFTINLSLEGISGSLLEKPLPLSMTMIYSKGAAAIYSSELFAFSGYISENGEMDFSVPQDRALSFNIKGNAYSDNLDVKIQNINADLSRLLSYFNLGDFAVNRASLKGNLNIGGIKSDPDFEGSMLLSGVEWEMSSLVPYRLTAGRIPITFEHNHIQIPEFKGLIKRSNAFFASADVYFDRWNFDRLDATLRTPKDAFIPVSVNVPQAQLKGDLSSSVQISFQDNIVDLQGYLNFKNTNAKVTSRDLFTVQAFGSKQTAPKKEMYVHTDLDIFFGQHVNFTFDPVLRAVFVPETKFNLKCDTEDNSFNLDGDILLKSGDIAYLSRNFYLKNGILRFNKNETSFNPYITVTAETRERDSDGNDVRIILSVLNQELLNFEPQFSSIPVKSENEIRTMLGQIAIGDSENVSSLLLATGDYAIQSTIGRSLENTLREYLNFDIFSVRTKVLQNALKQNFSTGSDENKRAIGNYLDNSTVYIGKYFGSSLYADALMHLSYGEGIEGKFEGMSNGLEFQPEIGFEMDISQMFAPVWNIFLPKIGLNPSMAVANIRWSMDFNYQPATAVPLDFNNAITLSWKLSF
nr:translocation/assembly module TamB [Treponema sp.]